MMLHDYMSKNPTELWIEYICPAVSEICILQSLDPNGAKFDKFLAHE